MQTNSAPADIVIDIIKNNQNTRKMEYNNLNFSELSIAEIINICKEMNPNEVSIPVLMKFITLLDENSAKDYLSEMFGIEATENLLMSKSEHYLNTNYAKQFWVYNSYEDLSPELKFIVKEMVIKQVGITLKGGISKNAAPDDEKYQYQNEMDNLIAQQAIVCIG